jgi:hypothetical protein
VGEAGWLAVTDDVVPKHANKPHSPAGALTTHLCVEQLSSHLSQVWARAQLEVSVALPAWMNTLPAVQQVGDGVLESILAGIKLVATMKLPVEYALWAERQQGEEADAR